MEAPSGFPIVTEKRSFSTFSVLARQQKQHHCDGNVKIIQSSIKESENGEDDRSQHLSASFEYKIPIRECPFEKENITSRAQSTKAVSDPVGFTTLETDVEQMLTATITIRYYDEVKIDFDEISPSIHQSVHSDMEAKANTETNDVGDSNISQRMICVTTRTQTVAHICIHIADAREPSKSWFESNSMFENAKFGNLKGFHKIVLSGVSTSKEVTLEAALEEINILKQYQAVEAGHVGSGIVLDSKSAIGDGETKPLPAHDYTFSDVEPQIVFSSNGKYLACIIPRPIRKRETASAHKDDLSNHSTGLSTPKTASISKVSIKPEGLSSVIIFQLEQATFESETSSSGGEKVGDLPLPKYLQMNDSYSEEQRPKMTMRKSRSRSLPIPSNPQIVSLDPMSSKLSKKLSKLISQISCLVDIKHKKVDTISDKAVLTSASMLLAGCTDGSMIMIAYKKAIALGITYESHDSDAPRRQNGAISDSQLLVKFGWDGNASGFRSLQYETEKEFYASHEVINGRLVGVQRCGRTIIFDTEFQEIFENENVSFGPTKAKRLRWFSKNYSFQMAINPFRVITGHNVTSCYTRATLINYDTVALLVKPLDFENTGRGGNFTDDIVQVWSVNADHSSAKLLSKLSLDHVKLESVQHDSVKEHASDRFKNTLRRPSAVCQQTFLNYDHCTGCLSLSSAVALSRSIYTDGVDARVFSMIWDWRTCTIGFTASFAEKIHFSHPFYELQGKKCSFTPTTSAISSLRFCRKVGTNYIVHVCGNDEVYVSNTYDVAVLSPSTCNKSDFGMCSQNPVMLGDNYVMYPDFLPPTVNKEIQIKWKKTILPISYLSKNGPVQSASIGEQYGRSLAIFCSKGLCVLNVHRETTNSHFSNVDGELEGSTTTCTHGFVCEEDEGKAKSTRDQWSMFFRTDENMFSVKAIKWWENYNGDNEDAIIAVITYTNKPGEYYLAAWSCENLKLGEHQLILDVSSVRKIAGRSSNLGLCLSKGLIPEDLSILTENRGGKHAVVSIVGTKNGSTVCSIIQMQVKIGDGNDPTDRILAFSTAYVNLPNEITLHDHIFLAGCSYQYDLELVKYCEQVATLGILHSDGLSITALNIEKSGFSYEAEITNLWKKSATSHRITRFWKSDYSPTVKLQLGVPPCSWTWSFLKANGAIFSWSLGSFMKHIPVKSLQFCLHEAILLQESIDESNKKIHYFGIKSDESKGLKGSITEDTTTLVGILHSKEHSHLLYTGQKAIVTSDTNDQAFVSGMTLGASDFEIGIPSSASSILMHLSLIAECYLTQRNKLADDLSLDLCIFIQNLHGSETIFSGLRAIISFLTELISKKEDRDLEEESERKSTLKSIQAVLVHIAISALIQVQFVSLFLNVGRQLEPHPFKSLFPLSLSVNAKDESTVLSLQDLFDMSVEDGSFSIPSSALPLFSNKRIVHNLCVNLLHHCIEEVHHFIDSGSLDVKCLREEFKSMKQLYSYILKVEVSEKKQQRSTATAPLSHNYSDEESSYGSTSTGEYEDDESRKIVQKIKSPGRISRMTARIIKPFSLRKIDDEGDAISQAAAEFVRSSYLINDSRSVVSESSVQSISDSVSATSSTDEGDMASFYENSNCAAFTASGVIGMSIVSKIFLSENDTLISTTGVRGVGILCVLLNNDEEESTLTDILVSEINSTLKRVSLENLRVTLKMLHTAQGASGSTPPLEDYTRLLLDKASRIWNKTTAMDIIATIVSIIQGNVADDLTEIDSLLPLLTLVLLSACRVYDQHVFERIEASDVVQFLQKCEDPSITLSLN